MYVYFFIHKKVNVYNNKKYLSRFCFYTDTFTRECICIKTKTTFLARLITSR